MVFPIVDGSWILELHHISFTYSYFKRDTCNRHRYNLKPSENEALKELKEKLNVTYENQQVSIWGIPITMTTSKGSEVVLLKFLRARKFNVQDSCDMIVKCLLWRKEFGADTILEQDFAFEELEGAVSYISGIDKRGCPVWWNNNYGIFKNKEIYRKYLGDEKKLEKFIRWTIQVVERGIKKLNFKHGGINSITQVYDAKDLPIREVKFIFTHIHSLLDHNYPEIVDYKIIINAPVFIRMASTFYRPWTTSKIVVCNEENVAKTLYKYIKPEYIPIQYGGLRRHAGELDHGLVLKPASEFMIKGWKKIIIPSESIKPGATITWDVVVKGWDLEYRSCFMPDASKSDRVDIDKARKLIATDEVVHNSYTAEESGRIFLIIRNQESSKSKVGAYRYLVQNNKVVYDI